VNYLATQLITLSAEKVLQSVAYGGVVGGKTLVQARHKVENPQVYCESRLFGSVTEQSAIDELQWCRTALTYTYAEFLEFYICCQYHLERNQWDTHW
jgi:hypothetical protein